MLCLKKCNEEPKGPEEPKSTEKPKCKKDKILENIKAGMYTETQAIELYSELLKKAKNEMHREYIEHAYEDEQKHLKNFTELYIFLTGC